MNHTGYQQVVRETHFDVTTGLITKVIDYTFGHDEISQSVQNYDATGQPTGNPETLIFGHDGHGSVRVLTDLVMAVAQIFTYDAYGQLLSIQDSTGNTITGTGLNNLANAAMALTTLLYSGEQFDTRIGQQYLRARYYDAAAGMFNRLDPFFGNLDDSQSFHKYLYTHADPVNGIDPTGLADGTLSGLISGMNAQVRVGVADVTAAINALRNAKTAVELYQAVRNIGVLLNTAWDTLNIVFSVFDLLTLDPSDLIDIYKKVTKHVNFYNIGAVATFNMPTAIDVKVPGRIRGKLGSLFANGGGQAAEMLGTLGAVMVGKALDFQVRDIPVFYHGFDALMYEPYTGRYVVVEAKGNSSKLSPSGDKQMSSKWIDKRVDKIIATRGKEIAGLLKIFHAAYAAGTRAYWATVVNLRVKQSGKVDMHFQMRTHSKFSQIQYNDWDKVFRK